MVEELLAAEHLSRVAEEDLRQRELACAQLGSVAVDLHASRAQVESGVARAQHGRLGRAVAAQPHTYAREELLEPEGLRHVVVRTALEPADRLADAVAGGQDDHGQVAPVAAELAQHVHAVAVGEAQVEDQELEVLPGRKPQRLLAGAGDSVKGDVQYFENRGSISITSNRIDGNLQCKENSPPPTGGGNIVQGNKEDQCARL